MKKSLPKYTLLFLAIVLIAACEISPVAIDYNEDQCHACKMMIADTRFGAELITKKGKVYKFDAAECMVRELNQKGQDFYELVLVTDFKQPKKLIDARAASFLISKQLPSPMGADLSAYASEAMAKAAVAEKGGQVFSWEQLKKIKQFNK